MQMGRLSGKRIVITASAQGIGRACTELFVREGAHVHAIDVDADKLATLEANPSLRTHALDGTDDGAVRTLLSSLKLVDALVHCIGFVHHGSVLECDHEQWDRSFRTNVDSYYYALQSVLPGMQRRGAGSIVCIASVASSIKGFPHRAAYGATKAAMIGLTKSVAVDFVKHGIRCNAVCPGTVTSPSLIERINTLGESLGDVEQARSQFISRQPMNRLGTPEEIAALCLYLASDESRFVTGQTLSIDGGITI